MQNKDGRKHSLDRGFIEGARVKGQEQSKVPAAREQVAWEGFDDESAKLALEQVRRVKREPGVAAGSSRVAEWFLNSSVKADNVEGGSKSSGN